MRRSTDLVACVALEACCCCDSGSAKINRGTTMRGAIPPKYVGEASSHRSTKDRADGGDREEPGQLLRCQVEGRPKPRGGDTSRLQLKAFEYCDETAESGGQERGAPKACFFQLRPLSA